MWVVYCCFTNIIVPILLGETTPQFTGSFHVRRQNQLWFFRKFRGGWFLHFQSAQDPHLMFPSCGGFHKWMVIVGEIPSRNGWWLGGTPMTQETPMCPWSRSFQDKKQKTVSTVSTSLQICRPMKRSVTVHMWVMRPVVPHLDGFQPKLCHGWSQIDSSIYWAIFGTS